jgi:hypothetical protein
MKLDDYKAEVPSELSKLAEDWKVEKCWIFPGDVWKQVIQMRKTQWKNKWGGQYK